MIKTISNLLLVIFLSCLALIGRANDNCATTNAQVNLSIPCVSYQGQDYALTLNAISHNKGGFVQSGANDSNWIGYVSDFKDSEGQQLFDIIVGFKDPQTQVPDSLGFIVQPSTTGSNWQLHDPESNIIYAGSNMPPFAKAGALDFSTIRSWIDKRLQELQANQINSLYWHDSLHNYGTDEDTTARLLEWESFLNEYIDPKVAAGKIRWATFTEMAELYKSKR